MQNKKRLTFAHRGLYGGNIPENSLAAFRNAIEAGLDIELDVRLSRDGVPVVFHDRTLKRMCGDSRAVSELTLAELKQLSLNGTDHRIPALTEVLELAERKAVLLIETKPPKDSIWNRRLEKRLLPLLKDYNGKYMVQSFNRYSVRYMKKRLNGIKCGILSGSHYPEPESFDFISYRLSDLTENKSRELKEKYPLLFAWSVLPVDSHKLDKAVERFGLDGVII